MAAAAAQPVPLDGKNSVLLSGWELSHISRLASMEDADRKQQIDKRTQQRMLSHARYKNWNNTLEAVRQKKQADKLKAAQQQELLQQQIDAEEAQYQEAQRRVILDRANRLLWQENDKVKHLHSGVLYANVLKEREQQLELKQKRKDQLSIIEKSFELVAEENRQKGLAKEKADEAERLKKNQIAQQQQLEQLRLFKLKQLAERREDELEGQRIKQAALELAREEELAEQRKIEQQRAYNKEYLRANEESLAVRAERAAQEERENDLIAKFAYEKERAVELRREHEAAKQAQKAQRHAQLLQQQYDHLLKIKQQEQARLERQVQELKEKEDADFADRQERARKLAETIRLSRSAQLRRKAEEAERQRVEDAVMAEEWRKRAWEMEEAEKEAEYKQKDAQKRLQATLREQMVRTRTQHMQDNSVLVREERVRQEIERERDESVLMQQAREREDAVFHAYAQQQMQELTVRGKSTLPVQLVLHQAKMRTMRPGNFQFQNFR